MSLRRYSPGLLTSSRNSRGRPVPDLSVTLPSFATLLVLAFVLAAASLYVSSLSGSAVPAAVLSFAVVTIFFSVAAAFAQAVRETSSGLAMLAVAGVLLLRFVFVNHRSESHPF